MASPLPQSRALFDQGRIACAEGRFEQALISFQRASVAGHARSFYWMAKLYWRGQGVRQNVRMAELVLQQGAAQNDPASRRALRFLAWQRRRRR